MFDSCYRGKRVLVTGHTGFKGSWLALWLHQLGAEVFGYSLKPPTAPSNYVLANVGELLADEVLGDVRDRARLTDAAPLANTDRFMNDALRIGLYPGMGADRLDYMAATIRAFFAEAAER